MTTRIYFIVFALFTFLASAFSQQHASSLKQDVSPDVARQLQRFESTIDQLRQELMIPAVSAAIIKDQRVLWARGFGFADLEKKIPATEHTSYHLASLTKTFASNIVMNLVKEGRVNLDDPVAKYGILLESNGVIRLRHIFSHTSEGNPGEQFRYSGSRYSELDNVIEKTTGFSFGELVVKNILEPLGMNESTPNAISALSTQTLGDPMTASEIRDNLNKLFRALNAGDAETIGKFAAKGSTVFQAEGGFRSQFFNDIDHRGPFNTGGRLNLEEHNEQVDIRGNNAVVTCYLGGTITFPNRQPRPYGPYRASFVWTKEEDGWKIVHAHFSPLTSSLLTDEIIERYRRILPNVAQPYQLDSANHIITGAYPTYFGTAAGLISSVTDLAKYDIALDQHKILDKTTQQIAWSPTISTKGDTLPYGLGWFTTTYRGIKLIWHYGWWNCNSSLILKVPEKDLTFIVLANTDNLSRSSNLGGGDVTSSPMGLEFLKQFVLPELSGKNSADIDWSASTSRLKESIKILSRTTYRDLAIVQLLNQARIEISIGHVDKASNLFKIFAELNSKPLPQELAQPTPIAQIAEVTDNKDTTIDFSVKQAINIRVFALGEAFRSQLSDYGWIEENGSGKSVWVMKLEQTIPAGGDEKNRMVDTVFTLPAGPYRLHYKSDGSHSFDHWNAIPPDYNFWGIIVLPTY